MPSLDFDQEKAIFREYHDQNIVLFEDAKNTFISIVNTLLTQAEGVNLTNVEGRVKEREEAINKFQLKYQKPLETSGEAYEIRDHITDLIGIRAICLYEDDIVTAADFLKQHFDVIDVTNKISAIESTEGSFGYKGLHMDMRLNQERSELAEYLPYSSFQFEIQIRTIIQDSWSTLDHKIKYKKSIPNRLKRRINTLSALFELADREFKEIRDSTKELEEKAIEHKEDDPLQNDNGDFLEANSKQKGLNAFNFLKVSSHFYRDYEFESYKVDGFVQDILEIEPDYKKGNLNDAVKENKVKVFEYQSYYAESTGKDKFNPYTAIRHCLYLSNKDKFKSALTNASRENFDKWLVENA